MVQSGIGRQIWPCSCMSSWQGHIAHSNALMSDEDQSYPLKAL